jgi:hypothetical protein
MPLTAPFKLYDEKPISAPLGCYLVKVPGTGAFLETLLPYTRSLLGRREDSLFYAVVDDFGNLVAVA